MKKAFDKLLSRPNVVKERTKELEEPSQKLSKMRFKKIHKLSKR